MEHGSDHPVTRGSGSPGQKQELQQLQQLFNRELLSLIRLLPSTLQERAAVFLMQFAGTGAEGESFSFFTRYYTASWSWLYWLSESRPLAEADVRLLARAHGAAILAHHLDDVLVDGQTEISILLLQLRTVVWNEFVRSSYALTEGEAELTDWVTGCIESYFHFMNASSGSPEDRGAFYEGVARHAATWFVAPAIAVWKSGRLQGSLHTELVATRDTMVGIIKNYYYFMRLDDDREDIHDDAFQGVRSGAYFSLPEQVRSIWDQCQNQTPDQACWQQLEDDVLQYDTRAKLRSEALEHLEEAIRLASLISLPGLADDIRSIRSTMTE